MINNGRAWRKRDGESSVERQNATQGPLRRAKKGDARSTASRPKKCDARSTSPKLRSLARYRPPCRWLGQELEPSDGVFVLLRMRQLDLNNEARAGIPGRNRSSVQSHSAARDHQPQSGAPAGPAAVTLDPEEWLEDGTQELPRHGPGESAA